MDVPSMETWWYEPDPDSLRCLICQNGFAKTALVRTFKVTLPNMHQDEATASSKTITTHTGWQVVLFDRHLHCLKDKNVRLLAISHVWDPTVSQTQQLHLHSPQDPGVKRTVTEEPVRMYRGVDESGEAAFEL